MKTQFSTLMAGFEVDRQRSPPSPIRVVVLLRGRGGLIPLSLLGRGSDGILHRRSHSPTGDKFPE